MAFEHVSVLLHETVDGLNVKPDGIYVDATLGGGGHAYEVCTKLGEQGRLIGIDQDADAIKAAGKRLEGFGEKVTIIRSNYCDMKPRLHEIGIDKVDGITFFLILEFLLISWIQLRGDFHIGLTHLLICVWISVRR